VDITSIIAITDVISPVFENCELPVAHITLIMCLNQCNMCLFTLVMILTNVKCDIFLEITTYLLYALPIPVFQM